MQGVAEYYPPALVVYGVIVAIGHLVLRPRATEPQIPPPEPPPMVLESECVTRSRTVAGAHDMNPSEAVTAATDGHIAIRQWNRVHLVRVEDIDFVEAEDNYVVVHAASRSYKGRDRISDVESQLDARRFVRIHRSTIVHLAKIREVQPLTHGDYAVILRDGKVLRVARSRRPALEQALGIEL
jgi:DNA-binding LytR/AlgR family response regulator